MHTDPLLRDLTVLLAVSLLSVCLLRRVGLPSVVGYLVAGFAFGPSVLGLVQNTDSVRSMAEIGLVFLLFTIGLKFSLGKLAKVRGLVLGAGGGQVALCAGATVAVGSALGLPTAHNVVVGCVLALSSTALVAKLLEERGDVETPHGRVAMSILLAQDLAVVPMLVVIAALGGEAITWQDKVLQLAYPIALLAAILVAAFHVVPRLLRRAVATRSREVVNLTIVAIAMGTAFATGKAGVPLELGAFLAGVIVAESDYADHVLSEVAPLRDVFAGLFFVSMGMLVDPRLWLARPGLVAGGVLVVVLGKAAVVGALALAYGFDARTALIAGLGLGQVGEFSYVLAQVAAHRGLLSEASHATVVSIAAVTMAATPFVFAGATRAAERIDVRRMPAWLRGARYRAAAAGDAPQGEPLEDHVIIVGYGPSGRNIAQALEAIGVRHVALELNPLAVEAARAEGRDVRYGDAGSADVLYRAGLSTARAVVVSTGDPTAARLVTSVARNHRSDVLIIARTRFLSEVDELYRLGADAVASEEFEISIAIAGMLLPAYGCTPASVEREQRALREGHYRPFRTEASAASRPLRDLLTHVELDEVTLTTDSPGTGSHLEALDLRKTTGALVVALEREGSVIIAPSPALLLRAGDRLFLAGDLSALSRARRSLTGQGRELSR